MKNVYILGATGSIGTQTLDVVNNNKNDFNIVGISLGRDDIKNFNILDKHKVEIACLRSDEKLRFYQNKYRNIEFVYGKEGLIDIAKYPKPGILVNALSGDAGLLPTYEAIKTRKDIALANKETLVMAGDMIMQAVNDYGVNLYPVDSEHSSIWTLLKGENIDDIKKVVITASGGSFRDLTRKELENVTVTEALKHPNWNMGPKITIDSATMANKCFEIIEAHHLFDLPFEKIEACLHRESIAHALVFFKDNTIKADFAYPDMKIPITAALYYPNRKSNDYKKIELSNLTFEKMDVDRFPLIKMIYEVGNKGGLLPAVFNSANDAAVELFLNGKIKFLDIEKIIIDEVNQYINNKEYSLENIILIKDETRNRILKKYERK